MSLNLMKMFGFGEDDFNDYSDSDEPSRGVSKRMNQGANPKQQWREAPVRPEPRLVFFKGVPSEGIKLKLRDALLDGIMVLLDLNDLSQRELEESGTQFITFMTGVAFAHRGSTQQIDQGMYLLTPYEGMFEEWVEEDNLNDGAFDRQGR